MSHLETYKTRDIEDLYETLDTAFLRNVPAFMMRQLNREGCKCATEIADFLRNGRALNK